MILAVKFVSDLESNPKGLPIDWPSTVLELEDGSELPAGYSALMTKEQYDDYIAAHQADFDAWESTQPDPTVLLEAAQKQQLRDLLGL